MSQSHAIACPQVELGAKEKPAGSDSQGPSDLETEQASPEESSTGTGEHLEV